MLDILSSDILEQQFSPTTVDVLYQDDMNRVIRTRVIDSGQILEISQVSFVQLGIDAFPDIHHEIVVNKKSIGKAFQEKKISFIRMQESLHREVLSEKFASLFDSNEPVSIITVAIFVGPQKTPYAKIFEVYSPMVQWPARVKSTQSYDSSKLSILEAILDDSQ